MSTSALNPSSPLLSPRSDVSVKNLPINLFASVIGLAGLALAWRLAHGSLGAPGVVGEAVGAFAIAVFVLLSLGYLTKLVKYPQAVRAEFAHPVAGSFFGTVAISVLLLSALVEPRSAAAAQLLWTIGVVATFALSFVTVSRLFNGNVDASHALPAWIVPCVATLDIPVTGQHMPMAWAAEINLLACAVGAMLALVLFALIASRLVHREPLAAAATPSLMILVAPFAVGFNAYTNVVGEVDRFAALLFYFGLFMFAVVAPKVFRPSVSFSSAWWAIGFPAAALVNAALKYAAFRNSGPLWALAIGLLVALSLALAVLAVRTLHIALNGKLFT